MDRSQAFLHTLGPIIEAFRPLCDPVTKISPLNVDLPTPQDRVFVFTSTNGVAAYGRQHAPDHALAYCVNENTAEAARALGFRVVQGQSGAAELAQRIDAPEVHYVRGATVSVDLADMVHQRGITCHQYIAYSQSAVALSGTTLEMLAGQNIGGSITTRIAD